MRTSPLRAFASQDKKNTKLKDLSGTKSRGSADEVNLSKMSGLGPRAAFGGVINPELQENIVKHEQSKYTDFENPVTRNEIYKKTEKSRRQ